MAKQQTEKDIKHLAGLDKIRSKVSMYLGSSDGSAMWTAIREALDNTIDEANQGRNDHVHLIKDPENKWGYWIADHGGGMPVKDIQVTEETTNKKVRISALKALVFLLHAGGKFDQSDSEGGLRGCFVGGQPITVSPPITSRETRMPRTVTMEELWKESIDHPNGIKDYLSKWELQCIDNKDGVHYYPAEHIQLSKYADRTLRIYSEDGLVMECTEDHPVYVSDGVTDVIRLAPVKAKDLRIGSWLYAFGRNIRVERVVTMTHEQPVPVYGITMGKGGHRYAVTTYFSKDNPHPVRIQVGNTHGVGIKALNAVSTVFKVWTYREKQWYYTEYAKGKEVEPVGKGKAPSLPHGFGSPNKGTVIYVELDPSVFDKGSKLDEQEILSWFETTSYFTSGVTLQYTNKSGETQEWEGQEPIDTLLADVENTKASLLQEDSLLTETSKFWDLGLAFTDYDGVWLQGYASGLYNEDGGTHVQTVFKAVSDVVSQYAKRGHNFNPSDLREGMVGFINVKLTGVKFHNQEKTKLVDERAGNPLYEEIYPIIEAFFKQRKELALLLCDRASRINDLKADFKANKAVLKVFREQKKRNALPTKLVSSLGCTSEERELFICEGDSAGGSAKRARDASFQEVLPLKGKIKNPFKQQATDSEELLSILMAIGYDPTKEDPLESIRVGRIIMLTDSDVDGPLLGSQKVMLADGTSVPIKELAERWKKDRKPFKVLSLDRMGNTVQANAVQPKIYSQSRSYARITLANGGVLECTLSHKWLMYEMTYFGEERPVITDAHGHRYLPARLLVAGDKIAANGGYETVAKVEHIKTEGGKLENFYCLTVPNYGNFLVDDGLGKGTGVFSSNCHIQTLVLGALLAYVPEVFEQGRVYAALPYEYMVQHKGEWYFDNDIAALRKRVPQSVHGGIFHLKGLGEVDSDVLSDMAFNPEKRKLFKITPENLTSTIKRVKALMESEGGVERKKLLGLS